MGNLSEKYHTDLPIPITQRDISKFFFSINN